MLKLSLDTKTKTKLRNTRTAFIFLLPALVMIGFFVIYPFGNAIYQSFFLLHPYQGDEFVGFRNYSIIITDKYFWYSLWVGIKYILFVIPIQFIFAFAIAMFIKSKAIGGRAVKATIYIPNIISGIVAGSIFLFMFNYNGGLFNEILKLFNLSSKAWTQDFPFFAIVFPGVWLGMGYVTLVMHAALLDIPKEYYEAAQIDGANKFVQLIYITLPSMKNILIYLLVTSVSGNIQVFDTVYLITGGGPGNETTTPTVYIYYKRFGTTQGQAIAASMVLFLILAGLAIIMLTRMKSEKSIEG